MADSELQNVINALRGTLSPDQRVREDASSFLMQYANVEGYLGMLMSTLSDESAEEKLRTSAAAQFKALVKARWRSDQRNSENYSAISEAEKTNLKMAILPALTTKIVPIRNLLEDSLRVMVSSEFPHNWPTLGGDIMSGMQADDQQTILASLVALRSVMRRYDETPVDARDQLFDIVDASIPLLKNLLEYVLSHDTIESQEIQTLIMKVFWASTTYGLAPVLQKPEMLDAWMNLFSQIFAAPIPVDMSQMDEYHRQKLPYWAPKKWVIDHWIRLTNRYLRQGAQKKTDTPEFVQYFASKYPIQFLEAAFSGISAYTQGSYLPPRILTGLLDFLYLALSFAPLWITIKPHVWDLIKGVFVPLLVFNEEDMELFECEPHAYISRQQDPLLDESNPRTPALTFLHDLVSRRGPEWLQELVSYLNTEIFVPYMNAPPDQRNYNLKYAALDIIGNLSSVFKKSENFKHELEQMLVSFVFPDIYDAPGFMKAKACWVFSRYCLIEYSDPNNFVHGIEGTLKCLMESTELPVVADAAIALYDIIPSNVARPILGPIVPDLVQKYLSLIEVVDSESIVGTLQWLIRHYPGPIRKSALELVKNLAHAFHRAYNKSNNITDGDDTEADDAFTAASQTVRAIHVLYKAVRKSPQVHPMIEPLVLPILEITFSREGSSFIEDGLALMTEVTYFGPTPYSAGMWKIFTLLAAAYLNWAPDHMQEMLPSFDNFISRDKETFLAPGTPYLDIICSFASKYFVDPKYPELDMLPLTRLFEVLLLECTGRIDHIIAPLLKLTVERLLMGGSEPFKVIMEQVILNCLWYNPSITVEVLESNGWTQGVFQTLFDLILEDHFERVCDKKCASLGLGSLLRLPFAQLPPYVQEKFQQIVLVWMQLTQKAEEQRIGEHEEVEEDEEGGWSDDEDEELEEDEDEFGDVLDSDNDDDEDFELLEAQALAQLKADFEGDEAELDEESLYNLAGMKKEDQTVADDKDLPDDYGPVGNLTETFLDSVESRWTLTGQEASSELPTEHISEVVYLAETLQNMDQQILNQLLSGFNEEQHQLYEHLNEVANDKVEKQQFEEQVKAEKAAKRANLGAFYQSLKQ